MVLKADLSPAGGDTAQASPPTPGLRLTILKAHLVAWLQTCADYYRAASLYDQLSMLSDAELRRRGLHRATLGRDVCQTLDRTDR